MDESMPLIELSGVGRSFEGEGGVRIEALQDVSLQINAGEFVCITGPSGAGKSTLVNILGCLDRPSSGSYRLAGREVGQLGADARAWLRRHVFGFVFQSYNLIDSRNSAENVELPGVYAGLSPRKRRKEAEELLSQLGLSDRTDHLPSELSGGEQQRVAIARALFNGGRIILADEPTGALDRPTGEEVLRALENLAAKGHTVILIS
ncbi:MAG: ABC transporter ATP-binding protein, partial [Gammaproteobacteria bacterium]|nr:ABC transporter ATP-binding protein [Gammaproteobacteria bacterium]